MSGLGKTVVSNATRWDTFDKLLGEDKVPESEKLFKQRYKKAPSFFSMHMGVKAEVFAARPGRAAVGDCHHIILEDWAR
ncbi:putative chloroplast carotenoid isomerase [Haematococcus lacustris]|uniref:Putative chloroplast carotenoid isomerase n=1 Tax=Haematococcus lacustris TaxID=44745 RepID=A0A699YFD9_HAELA|nr:putative chloroplast carotenoid isomerase [Haematococcus lacustris]